MQGFTASSLALVALGGAAASVLRHLASLFGTALFGSGFPWGMRAVNILGSGAIGVLAALGIDGAARNLLIPGFLGGPTTFSAFSPESTHLWERAPVFAVAYVLLSVGLGLAASVLRFWLVRR
ncbi:CrcB family protein [Roseomonas eburnea]|uniref:Fluoride-specific ion channel FluC n=1 Tax=Neoroseomonas eburnea TaxID=1346889 RepID=A0A9X9XBV8_9PROT|nr:CrcB family protein [Neoroseomonas eburnea]MBR0681194.1 CrcB family protein [Neoroseomonas eburnea]